VDVLSDHRHAHWGAGAAPQGNQAPGARRQAALLIRLGPCGDDSDSDWDRCITMTLSADRTVTLRRHGWLTLNHRVMIRSFRHHDGQTVNVRVMIWKFTAIPVAGPAPVPRRPPTRRRPVGPGPGPGPPAPRRPSRTRPGPDSVFHPGRDGAGVLTS
jgi:hypothetical protein